MSHIDIVAQISVQPSPALLSRADCASSHYEGATDLIKFEKVGTVVEEEPVRSACQPVETIGRYPAPCHIDQVRQRLRHRGECIYIYIESASPESG